MWPWWVFGRILIPLICIAFWQILTCQPSCISRFLIYISSSASAQMLTYKFLNFHKFQTDIFNCEILNMCRALYTSTLTRPQTCAEHVEG